MENYFRMLRFETVNTKVYNLLRRFVPLHKLLSLLGLINVNEHFEAHDIKVLVVFIFIKLEILNYARI